jgi:hypothetical protein
MATSHNGEDLKQRKSTYPIMGLMLITRANSPEENREDGTRYRGLILKGWGYVRRMETFWVRPGGSVLAGLALFCSRMGRPPMWTAVLKMNA